MKATSVFYALFVLLFATSMSAQVLDKGNFLIGTTAGFSTAKSNVTYSTNSGEAEGDGPAALQFNIAPKIGYFIIDNFALGIGLDYTYSTVKEPNRDRTNDSDLLFGPFGRYYLPVNEDMALFLEANFGFGNSSNDQFIGENRQSVSTNVFAFGAGPGVTIFSNADIGIEALFKYNFARSRFDTENLGIRTTTTTNTNQFDFVIGLQFYFGGVSKIGG